MPTSISHFLIICGGTFGSDPELLALVISARINCSGDYGICPFISQEWLDRGSAPAVTHVGGRDQRQTGHGIPAAYLTPHAGQAPRRLGGAPIHRCDQVKRFLAKGAAKRLKLLPLPGYAPELNPDEGVWQWLKRVALGNVCCDTVEELRYELRLAIARLRHRKDVLAACIRRPGYIQ